MSIQLIGSAGGGEIFGSSLSPSISPLTDLPNGESINVQFRVPNNKTLFVWALGIQDNNGNTDPSLEIEVVDVDAAVTIESTTQKDIRSSDPALASRDGPFNAELQINNNSGTDLAFSYSFIATVEPTP